MSIRKALTYSYHRNIGWQDRTIRTVVGLMALAGAAYSYQQPAVATGMVILFLAQVATVFSARCMI